MRQSIISVLLFFIGAHVSNAAPKNIILLIGDGMGEAEIAIARAYEFDGNEGLYVDTMKNRGSVIVKQLMFGDPTKIQFAGESASGGTTLSTGHLTSAGRLAISAFDAAPYKTILEEAQERGLKTGLVATSIITDATPASFSAHAMNRYCFVQSSEACELFGDTPIIEQMLDNNVDIMLGGGTNLLPEAETSGKTVHEKATALGYTVVTDREALMELSPNTKTLGVFSNGHMPPEWQGKDGQSGDVIKFNEDHSAILYSELAACEVNPEHMGMPRLEEMSKYAIENLRNSEDGFFLMIEGALIDKQAHIAKPCGTIGDMLAFDRTVKMAVEYAKELGDTAVIVTADHGQATQVVFNVESFYPPLAYEHVKGLYQRLLTKGGNEITAYYGTNNVGDQSHTGVNVPIYTYGLDDLEKLTGVIQQTEIYGVMKDFLFN